MKKCKDKYSITDIEEDLSLKDKVIKAIKKTCCKTKEAIANTKSSVSSIGGKKVWILSLLLGAIASFGFPPISLPAAFIFSLVLLLWLLDGIKKHTRALIMGFFFGFGLFALGLSWINYAIITYTPNIAFMAILCFIGCGIFGGFYVGLTAFAASFFPKGISRTLAFAALWIIAEWIRSWLFTGFPWNLTAYIWDKDLPLLQITAYIGSYGLGLLTMLLIAYFALLPILKKTTIIAGVLALVLIYMGGALRIDSLNDATLPSAANNLRIVQPAIKDTLTASNSETATDKFKEYLSMSVKDLPKHTEYILWGETALPFNLQEGSPAYEKIISTLPADTGLITGIFRRTTDGKVYNSSALMKNGEFIGFYDKSHLVPFGEYVPFRNFLPLEKFTMGIGDLSQGTGVKTFILPNNLKVGMLICYEIIFPSKVIDSSMRPDWLLNLTYDGWYGKTSGPYQHFAAARLRAIEEGVPIVRVAASGISGVISPLGDVRAYLGLDEKGTLDFTLPHALPATLYSRMGNLIPLLLSILLLGIAGFISFSSWFFNKSYYDKKAKERDK